LVDGREEENATETMANLSLDDKDAKRRTTCRQLLREREE